MGTRFCGENFLRRTTQRSVATIIFRKRNIMFSPHPFQELSHKNNKIELLVHRQTDGAHRKGVLLLSRIRRVAKRRCSNEKHHSVVFEPHRDRAVARPTETLLIKKVDWDLIQGFIFPLQPCTLHFSATNQVLPAAKQRSTNNYVRTPFHTPTPQGIVCYTFIGVLSGGNKPPLCKGSLFCSPMPCQFS